MCSNLSYLKNLFNAKIAEKYNIKTTKYPNLLKK